MCIGCVNILMKKVIGYLEFKNEELNDEIQHYIKESNNEDKGFLNILKRESVHVEELIEELNEFKEYNDEQIDKSSN